MGRRALGSSDQREVFDCAMGEGLYAVLINLREEHPLSAFGVYT